MDVFRKTDDSVTEAVVACLDSFNDDSGGEGKERQARDGGAGSVVIIDAEGKGSVWLAACFWCDLVLLLLLLHGVDGLVKGESLDRIICSS